MQLMETFLNIALVLVFIRVVLRFVVNMSRHNKAKKGVYADMSTYRPYLAENTKLLDALIEDARKHGDKSTLGLSETAGDVVHSYRKHGGKKINVSHSLITLSILLLLRVLITL